MRVFKFGGASVKDAKGVKNLISVLEQVGHEKTIIVVSAMGKMTNALELVVGAYFDDKKELNSTIQGIVDYHKDIMIALFNNSNHHVFKITEDLFEELRNFLKTNKSPDYSFVYDQVIGFGELLSTLIISQYLVFKGFNNHWLDVRQLIKTDSYYRNANVNWEETQQLVTKHIDSKKLNITQGFLGSDANNFTTTLGREGSDYTAAILAYCLNADSVTIWKDVPGVLNADPRHFKNTQLLNSISYTEAIELAFYGASVIHPKTLQPLQRKEIPLYVKSFLNPQGEGTVVNKTFGLLPKVPCFIVKKNQVLLSLSTLDFSYIVEDNISKIFNLLSKYKMKVSVIQNSAISFSVCFDDNYNNLETLLLQLKANFKLTCNTGVSLYTIRHYDDKSVEELEAGKTVLLKQMFQETLQIVTK
ncbi:aspartate kinase [Olleya sp. HaHaR_3_96]|uniref:aspartate kinase n=1 Tax=Olleya sp. HaHaR_3_96 TaxID=2745560 RepID=UPI001C4FFC83|nr:aspartate kinase [Olleya sp. HaHaR_3_96]QXP60968.1 aspartate kinase [Olleya sp. HaHaR_3_96]